MKQSTAQEPSDSIQTKRKKSISLVVLAAITLTLGLFRIDIGETHADSMQVFLGVKRTWPELYGDFFTFDANDFQDNIKGGNSVC
ncbi:MAG: hypothetical protein OEZ02_03975 [Anaerolineae bacterium]|nr:hypothetical protein [Anaerolineae bacterium]